MSLRDKCGKPPTKMFSFSEDYPLSREFPILPSSMLLIAFANFFELMKDSAICFSSKL